MDDGRLVRTQGFELLLDQGAGGQNPARPEPPNREGRRPAPAPPARRAGGGAGARAESVAVAMSEVIHNTGHPHSAVVHIEVTYPDGTQASGSGAVVGRNDVLTASHVIWAAEHGGLATSI